MTPPTRWFPGTRTATRGALLITGLYLLAGFFWILLSDDFVAQFAADRHEALFLQNVKGWTYVLVTGLGLFLIVRRTMRAAMRSGELEQLVGYCPVTGLPNAALLLSQVHRSLLDAAAHETSLSVLAIHVDGIRRLNDSLGPAAGDLALAAIAGRLRQVLAPGDMLARHDGSAFVCIAAPCEGTDRTAQLSRELLKAVATPTLVGGTEFTARGSVGVSRYPGDADSPRELIAAATAAMNRAREQGGWHVHRYSTRLTHAAYERFRMENALRKATDDGGLELAYQPQVRLADGQPVGVECLLRWTHPEFGPVPPSRFVPLAEECGLIQPIGEWVLREACRQGAAWRAAGLDGFRIAVNLSARQFGHRRLVSYVREVLDATGFEARLLELEITEHVTAREPEMALRILRALKDLGIGIAIDDFGIGYSSLSYLQMLPIDRLKIDRAFVSTLNVDRRGEAICRTILDMSRNLGLMTLAEGIETAAQHRALLRYGCEEGQGYLFARPMPADGAADWIRRDATVEMRVRQQAV